MDNDFYLANKKRKIKTNQTKSNQIGHKMRQ